MLFKSNAPLLYILPLRNSSPTASCSDIHALSMRLFLTIRFRTLKKYPHSCIEFLIVNYPLLLKRWNFANAPCPIGSKGFASCSSTPNAPPKRGSRIAPKRAFCGYMRVIDNAPVTEGCTLR